MTIIPTTPTTTFHAGSEYRDFFTLDRSMGHVEITGRFYLSQWVYGASRISGDIPKVDGIKFNSPGMTVDKMILTQIDATKFMVTFEGITDFSVTINGPKAAFDNLFVPQAGYAINAQFYGSTDWDGFDQGAVRAANKVTFLSDAVDNTSNGLDNSNDTINGGARNDTISGRSGNDVIRGAEGNDRLFGDTGNDTLNGGIGNNTLDGGEGTDLVTYIGSSRGVTVNLSTSSAVASGLLSDLIFNIENVDGSNSGDSLTGNDGANVINGLAGLDVLVGLGGNDTLNGGSGSDTLRGGEGDDSLIGNAHTNLIDGGNGSDLVNYTFAATGITLNLGITGAQNTGVSTDTLVSIENVNGSSHNDLITGNAVANRLFGLTGNDTVDGAGGADFIGGAAGDDLLIGGTDNDTLLGGDGNDALRGDDGSDRLDGAAGSDTLVGGASSDNLIGGQGDDQLQGGTGGDTMNGGAGSDILIGGDGADRFVYGIEDRTQGVGFRDVINDFSAGADRFVFNATASGGVLPVITQATFASWFSSHVFEDVAGNAIVDIGEVGGSVLLLGVGSEQLSFSNFIWS